MQQQQRPGSVAISDGGSCRGLPVDDPRLLVDGSGHMPFHYAASQCGLYNLLHPKTNLTTFALMLTTTAAGEVRSVRNSASSDCESSGGRRSSSLSGGRRSSSLSGGRRSSSLSADTSPVTTGRAPKEDLWVQLWAQLRKAHPRVPLHDSPGMCAAGVSHFLAPA